MMNTFAREIRALATVEGSERLAFTFYWACKSVECAILGVTQAAALTYIGITILATRSL